ncbi:N-acetyltransferase [Bacillus sp. FJAT-45350]|uniref:N-acetyltransferase n=1 Tax=Bacillus sp. FJAT-45350 TaxID=2011014 RepID=UPI000BB88D64|nr:N-acetyltransferase [Bacillus sp. FJAT-45350]
MNVRKAKMTDVEVIYDMIYAYAEEGLLLPRERSSLIENLQNIFVVVGERDEVYGAAGLHILGDQLAEIRSLVVTPSMKGKGIGRILVERVVEETRYLEIERLISLTYQVAFFHKLGFEIVDKDELPQKVWKDCIHCPKLHNCDEIAMVITVKDPSSTIN